MELVVTVEPIMTVECTLRRATAADAELFVAWRAQPSVRKYQPIAQLSVAQMRRVLGDRSNAPIDPSFDGKLQLVILADGEPAGWVSIAVVNRAHAYGNAGYTIAEEFRGHRLASRGLIEACELSFAKDGLALERIEANCTTSNIASARTLELAGFTREGIARGHLIIDGERVDHYRYGRLSTDPYPNRD
jgi:ribosomal-protein-alanine N-acetyltransferase